MRNKHNIFEKINSHCWQIPPTFQSGMSVPAVVYTSEAMLDAVINDGTYCQVVNMACLPGIVKHSLAMPDVHHGYGFPIGGVAAFNPEEGGIISPGGVGYDINCGVRLLTSDLTRTAVRPHLSRLLSMLTQAVPAGLGSRGSKYLSYKDVSRILEQGAAWVVSHGWGKEEDILATEEKGRFTLAQPDCVSHQAKESGRFQLGSLGSGNHFLEIQEVTEIYDRKYARSMGFFQGQVAIMIHCGSRKLGYQVCEDYVRRFQRNQSKYKIPLPDKQLACAPFYSSEAQEYLAAMASAANFAWANRQLIAHHVREVFQKIFGPDDGDCHQIYDVAHNIAKMETFQGKKLCVHRKGATRAYPDQAVLIPGSMGTASYVLLGTEKALTETFGSVCHGAGRVMSRHQALRSLSTHDIVQQLEKRQILLSAASQKGIVEEAPQAYKDIDAVVNVVEQAGLARKVVQLKPLAVIKG